MGQIEIHHPEFGCFIYSQRNFQKIRAFFRAFSPRNSVMSTFNAPSKPQGQVDQVVNRDDVRSDGTQEPYPAFGKPSENGDLTDKKMYSTVAQYSFIYPAIIFS